ncbi:MAG: WYL domain-containing protein [Oscillospiraceae bacterium]|nr:WYL domain-containing protein [Oscillospiraceae bacterium]
MAKNENMLFHEVYGSYYQAVAKILSRAVQGNLTRKDISGIVRQYAFAESWSNLTESFLNGDWPFLDADLGTELIHEPEMPLTTLQKRWLKAMLNDPRIRLFLDPEDVKGLEDVEPLFRQQDIYIFDRYADGDPYEKESYIANFRLILTALREDGWLEITQRNRWGTEITRKVKPLYLEYSPRDDKFRLHSAGTADHTWPGTIQTNVERILSCKVIEYSNPWLLIPAETQQAELILSDRRGVLNRFMRLFCWLKKVTVPMEEKDGVMRYHVTLHYEKTDEPELVIRLLSMGPDIEILSPDSLRQETIRRVWKQTELLK